MQENPVALIIEDASGAPAELQVAPGSAPVARPAYLEKHYWWAYGRPRALKIFDHQWVVEAILWGNYSRLRDAAMDALGDGWRGRTLQIAAAYGDFSLVLAGRVAKGGGELDVIDALPIQIANLRGKLRGGPRARASVMDAAALDFEDGAFDRIVIFFLLHEQPPDWRRKTLAEALRVVRRGGRVVIVEYARPKWWNPLRYFFRPVLALLEPFALDMWRHEISAFLPEDLAEQSLGRRTFFGGLYQLVSIERL